MRKSIIIRGDDGCGKLNMAKSIADKRGTFKVVDIDYGHPHEWVNDVLSGLPVTVIFDGCFTKPHHFSRALGFASSKLFIGLDYIEGNIPVKPPFFIFIARGEFPHQPGSYFKVHHCNGLRQLSLFSHSNEVQQEVYVPIYDY